MSRFVCSHCSLCSLIICVLLLCNLIGMWLVFTNVRSLIQHLQQLIADEAGNLFSYSTLLYLFKTLAVQQFLSPAALQQFLGWSLATFRAFRLRPPNSFTPSFNLLRRTQRFVADTGATNHLSYRLLDGDRVCRWERAHGVGGQLWIQMTELGHCILSSKQSRADSATGPVESLQDELCSIPAVVSAGGSFHWTPTRCWIEHSSCDPIELSVT